MKFSSAVNDWRGVGNSDELKRAELVPQTELAKCEDYKARAKAVPGLILAERKGLVAASECSSALKIFGAQLTDANKVIGRERYKRISAEKKVIAVGIIAFVSGAGLTILTFVLAGAFSK